MKKLHPLINPKSKHYDTGGKTAIEELEEQLTVIEMMGFIKGNIFKYEYRKAHKGQSVEDEEKIATYDNYMQIIDECSYSGYAHTIVKDAYKALEINFTYNQKEITNV
jgi:hypothetical protein